jgi:hypothetical protein
MHDVFQEATRFALLVFLLTGMLEAGLSLTWREIVAPLKKARLVLLALGLLANLPGGTPRANTLPATRWTSF